jgi:hypothetical protein
MAAPQLHPDDRLARLPVSRRRGSDLTLVWVALGLAGVAVGIYAIRMAFEPPAVPAPARVAAAAPEPPPPQVKRVPRRAAAQAKATPKEAPAAKAGPPVEYITEAPERKSPAPGDPGQEFESGELFDRPNGGNRRGQSGAGSFDNPTHGPVSSFDRPTSGYSARRAANPSPSERPNVPDPTFSTPR